MNRLYDKCYTEKLSKGIKTTLRFYDSLEELKGQIDPMLKLNHNALSTFSKFTSSSKGIII